MSTAKRYLTIEEQAEFLADLAWRCKMNSGATSDETFLLLSKEDAEKLSGVADRLFRMAPFEAAIRRMVTGR